MTTRLTLIPDSFEKVRRAELEALTGCPIHRVIDGTCREAGCPNAALQLQKEFVQAEDTCLRLREVSLDEGGPRLPELVPPVDPVGFLAYERERDPRVYEEVAPIFQTKPRMRCVL